MKYTIRTDPASVALETTLLLHGVPGGQGGPLARELGAICEQNGSKPAFVGVYKGRPTIGLTDEELGEMLAAGDVPKANTSNIGVYMHRGMHAATTVATTMELAGNAGLRVFATGGLGGVHREYGVKLDISTDLVAFTRHPLAVVTSGVKGLLDVVATREALETLGVPVVGFRTDRFPAFYVVDGGASVDARFDDEGELARFVGEELRRTGRGVVVANPVPADHAISAKEFEGWLGQANRQAHNKGVEGRAVTPFMLQALHVLSGGRTLRANIELVRSNVALGARLVREMKKLANPPWADPSRAGGHERNF